MKIEKGYCDYCESYAFIIDNCLSCCHQAYPIVNFNKHVNPRKGKPVKVEWNNNIVGERKFYSKAKSASINYKGKISPKIVQMVYEDNIKNNGTLTCYICGCQIRFGNDSLEHVVPRRLGGTNEYSNLRIAHRSCNSSKRDKSIEEMSAPK